MHTKLDEIINFLTPFLIGADLVVLALIALLLDTVLGGRKYVGRIIGPDHIFHSLLDVLCNFLDHDNYATIRRFLRGGLVLVSGIIVLIPLGLWLDETVRGSLAGQTFGVLLLMLIFGQKLVRDHAHELVQLMNDPAHTDDSSRHGAARWGIERQVLRMADGLVANGFILFISGFTGLLIYRFITMMVAVGSPKGIMQPKSPFYLIVFLIYELLTILPAIYTVLLTLIASFFTKAARFTLGAFDQVKGSLLSRQLPLMAVAHAMGFTFIKGAGLEEDHRWFGPKGGRDELTAVDITNALTLVRNIWIIEMLSLIVVLLTVFHEAIAAHF